MAVVTSRDAARALKQLPEYAKDAAMAVMSTTAYQVSRRAAADAPYRTGALRARVLWQARPRSMRAVVGVEPSAFYWRFQEHGTRFMRARPFLEPAAAAEEADHLQRMVEALERASTRMVRSATSGLV